MESVGERLIRSREEKQISLEQAARETHISKYFIGSLENEQFAVFPGESYLLGFLRKYSAYLDLDAAEMVALFKNTQIQEQQSPVVELLDKSPKKQWLIAILLTVIVISVIVTVVILNLPDPSLADQTPIVPTFQTVFFTSEILEQEFTAWTRIQVSIDDDQHELELREITSPLVLNFDGKSFQLEPDDVEFVDFDGDARADLRIVYTAILGNGNPVLRMDRVIEGFFARSSTEVEGPVNPGATAEPTRERAVQQIADLANSDPFAVEAIFRGPVLFRYLDEQGARVEQFYNSGDRFRLDVEEYLYIWVSNAGKLGFTVNEQELRLDRDGAVAAYKIERRENQLELIPLY